MLGHLQSLEDNVRTEKKERKLTNKRQRSNRLQGLITNREPRGVKSRFEMLKRVRQIQKYQIRQLTKSSMDSIKSEGIRNL